MSLKPGKSDKAVSYNAKELKQSGKPQRQDIAMRKPNMPRKSKGR